MKKQLILAGLILTGAALTFSGCGNSKNNQSTAPAEKHLLSSVLPPALMRKL